MKFNWQSEIHTKCTLNSNLDLEIFEFCHLIWNDSTNTHSIGDEALNTWYCWFIRANGMLSKRENTHKIVKSTKVYAIHRIFWNGNDVHLMQYTTFNGTHFPPMITTKCAMDSKFEYYPHLVHSLESKSGDQSVLVFHILNETICNHLNVNLCDNTKWHRFMH